MHFHRLTSGTDNMKVCMMYSTKQYVAVLMSIEVEGIKILMENIQYHLIQTIHTINRMFSAINLTSGD